jgi:hypothetical protein
MAAARVPPPPSRRPVAGSRCSARQPGHSGRRHADRRRLARMGHRGSQPVRPARGPGHRLRRRRADRGIRRHHVRGSRPRLAAHEHGHVDPGNRPGRSGDQYEDQAVPGGRGMARWPGRRPQPAGERPAGLHPPDGQHRVGRLDRLDLDQRQNREQPAGWLNASGVPEAAVLISNSRLAVSRYLAAGWTSWRKAGGGF